MNKHLLLISLMAISFLGSSQTFEVFNRSGGNALYSNAQNWANETKPPENGYAQFNAMATLDESVTIAGIRSAGDSAGVTDQAETLTLTGDGIVVDLQQNGPNAGGQLIIDTKMIYTSTENFGNSLWRVNGEDGIITFGENSDVDLQSTPQLTGLGETSNPARSGTFNFNGSLRGTGSLRVAARADLVNFGPTSDNSDWQGGIVVIFGNRNIIANNADNNVLIAPGQKVQVNAVNASVTLNGKNIYHGTMSIAGTNSATFTVNKDQPNCETIVLPGASSLTINLGAEVDTLHFNNLSGIEWDPAASVTISNFKNAALRFGKKDTALTATQLSQINIGGGTPSLNKNGYLIDQTLNTAPEASSIGNFTLAEGFSSREIDLGAYFTDPQRDSIYFTASSSANYVSVSVAANILTITESTNGTSTITVTCTDEFGASTEATFDVTVDEEVLDTDGDGIPDETDQCPDTPAGAQVDGNGCADSQKDTDNDGVTDDMDLCANTPDGATVDGDGCAESQKDADGDGITNDVDLCPDTPSGSTVDSDGCADSQKDTDGDGVTDDEDQCANTPSGTVVDANGCVVLSSDLASTTAFIYPNPAQHHLTINNLSKWEGGQLAIIDMSGRVLIAQKVLNEQNKMSIDQLKAGKYILKLQKGSDSETLSFIKGK